MLSLDENRPPIPPADLILRVVPSFDGSDVEGARYTFDRAGLNNLRLFERAVGAVSPWRFGGDVWLDDDRVGVGRSFGDFTRILDFGCGCGRLLRHLGQVSDAVEIHGTDIDAEMIEWLRANVSFGRFEVGALEPPLPYPDQYFDLVMGHSVFTHLDERLQDAWLAELQRITAPEGLVLLTVQGESTWRRTMDDGERSGADVERWRAALDSRGILFIADDAFVGSTHPETYHSTIHRPWYVFDHWSAYFDVEAYLPDGAWAQDLVVLRRRPESDGSASRPGGQGVRPRAEPAVAMRSNSRRARVSQLVARLAQSLERRRQSAPGSSGAIADQSAASAEALAREIAMIRAGLYEQGRRISVLGVQLRDEIASLRDDKARD